MNLVQAAKLLAAFSRDDLTVTLAEIESSWKGTKAEELPDRLRESGVTDELLRGAAILKQAAGRINDIIHASGILMCLPHILDEDEVIEYLSLASGNTGRPFDLETNKRIAEFKFIRWRGGAESVRQNGLFKDFYSLAEFPTSKRKCLYVLGTEHPMRFLKGGRAITSVLDRNATLLQTFRIKHGSQFAIVSDYYATRADDVAVIDASGWLSPLMIAGIEVD